MICDPMKLATSPTTKSSLTSSSSSSSSCKKDSPLQFGIPIPIICDWLNQHWEGSLDELTKPKIPIIRLMSAGQKSEHSCASFSLRQVFKSAEGDQDGTPSSSNTVSKTRDQEVPAGCSVSAGTGKEEIRNSDPHGAHLQGIPTPEIYESAKLTAGPVEKKDIKQHTQQQLLDINFPPKITKASAQRQPDNKLPSNYDDNYAHEAAEADISSTGSVNGAGSGLDSGVGGYSSEGETTMYSAETAESRNYTSPRQDKFQQVGRSQSCVSYNRWTTVHRNPIPRRAMLEQQRSYIHGKKVYSQGATSQRSNDYFSPTVSSIMKNRTGAEQPPPVRRKQQAPAATATAVQSSPRWNF
ncbi:hypothetical protein LINGRAHAP2_LOCUS29067 [Linum grandiflorum]